ncbi:hypothetical protein KZO01_14570 [Kurthia zopfii]|uniref:GntR family transcriptional regulator n=1 Tax=Kurthia zopfii TaxID=1650 RepID=A0A2U3AB80_9BACL|nr:GntR family transcriptional regulator [Kurthia zopfii]PWI21721.1 GntR family transcriptional regulator [Kurthia zopfii]TDR35783.1 GntR family transcriptional regulator [Kurthia zopfii]STX09687.1 transcriptional regulatory protein PtsJ [Kurthia zopfii]VEI06913.1 transcriptional regulatory protein PtsJ [Kurthia zopfii]GEK31148.1 hypothetical protein KZO01_14570 [Kurthia zopfii]
MHIQLDENSDVQLYRQLANQIIMCIARGELKIGDALPSVRTIAHDLNINVNTVSKSYHELADRGVIELKQKAKAEIVIAHNFENSMEQLEEAMKPILAQAFANGIDKQTIEKTTKKMMKKWKLKDLHTNKSPMQEKILS